MPLVDESGDHDSIITKRVNSSAGYFVFDKTQDYFPQIDLNRDNIPVGYPSPICVHLDWIKRGQDKLKKNYKKYLDLLLALNILINTLKMKLFCNLEKDLEKTLYQP